MPRTPRTSGSKTDSTSRTSTPPDHGTCVICLDDLDGPLYSPENPDTEGRLILPCGHAFHSNACLRPTVVAQAVTGQVTMSGWTREEISAMPELIFQRTAPSCPYCRTPLTAGTYWPDLTEADHLYRQNEGTYRGPNPDHPAPPSPDDDAYPQDDENGQEQTGTHTGPDTAGTGLNDQAHEIWAVVGHAVQDGAPDLPTRTYQALHTWPAYNFPDGLWGEILGLLPLEDQTRLAHTSHHVQEIVEQLAPQALDPTAHTTPDFTRTLYTQTELDTSLNENRSLHFIPGTDSNLTIGHGRARVHGPGTLTAVTGGSVTALGDIHITTVTSGHVTAEDQTTITAVTGGYANALDDTHITTVTDGTVTTHDQASITTVTGGIVCAYDQATITTVTGGNVTALDDTHITTVTDGTVHATDYATVTATGGDAHITAYGNAQVIIEAGAGGVCVDAYDAADITADSGTITIHSPAVTITSDGDAVIRHEDDNEDTGTNHEDDNADGGCTVS
ncbi:RING finger protein [Streptomyces sp. NPDC057910]|uniref:RING finger protein n=1 Tax=Streptomyces sp. NPDC057910 TaxID=3346278 RepID=UPI0036ED5F54